VRLFVLSTFFYSPHFGGQGGDSQFYHAWALRILQGQWTDHHAFYGLPGYAFVLAAFYKLFGVHVLPIALAQCLLDAGTATLVFLLARRLTPHPAWALLAAAGWALYVPAQTFSVILMPTVWQIFAYWLCVWWAAREKPSARAWAWLCMGLLVGVTATLVATILFVLPLLLISARRQWPAMAAVVAGVVLGTSPAWLHNRFVAHEPAFLSAHGGINFWIGNYPGANGYPKIPPDLRSGQQELLDDSIHLAEAAAGHPLTRPEVSRYWSEKAWAQIRAHPAAWLELLGLKLRAFWNAFSYDDLTIIALLREEGALLPGPGFGAIACVGLAGVIIAWIEGGAARWIAAAVLLHMAALMPVFITERYRMAAVPGLLVLAAFALSWTARRHWKTGVPILLLAAACVWLPSGAPQLSSMEPYNLAISELEAADRVRGEERATQLARAQAHLETAQRLAPDNANLLFAFGRLSTARGELPHAEEFYTQALAHDPRLADAYVNLAVLELRRNDAPAAAALLEKAAALTPQDAPTFYLLARARQSAGDLPGARAAITEAVRLAPQDPQMQALRQALERSP
jgi:tetratricopeptide (TPR) repeat protein